MRDVIIIGSGPAGYTAAIYAARAGLNPLLIASSVEAGGELMKTTEVENYPGFPEGLMGPDLMANFQAQAERFGTEILFDDVTEVDLKGDVKILKTGGGQTFEAKTVILATGAAYRELGLPREKDWRKSSLFLATSTTILSDKALTTDDPTPCNPPEVS